MHNHLNWNFFKVFFFSFKVYSLYRHQFDSDPFNFLEPDSPSYNHC